MLGAKQSEREKGEDSRDLTSHTGPSTASDDDGRGIKRRRPLARLALAMGYADVLHIQVCLYAS